MITVLERREHRDDYPVLRGYTDGVVREVYLEAFGQSYQFPLYDANGFSWKRLLLNVAVKRGGELIEPGRFYPIYDKVCRLILSSRHFREVKPVGVINNLYRIQDIAGSVVMLVLRPAEIPQIIMPELPREVKDLWIKLFVDGRNVDIPAEKTAFKLWASDVFTPSEAYEVCRRAEGYMRLSQDNTSYLEDSYGNRSFLGLALRRCKAVERAAALPKDVLIALYTQHS